METITWSIDLIEKAGLIGLLTALIVIIVWGIIKGHWVPGWVYQECKADGAAWKSEAMRLMKIVTKKETIDEVETDK